MRKLSIALLSVLVVTLFAVPAFAQIAGSKHDFTVTGNGRSDTYTNLVTETQGKSGACQACHVPHNGTANTILFGSYYNGGTGDVADAGGYTAYGTTNAGSNASSVSNPISIMCMSCHDGTITANTSTDQMTSGASYNLGTSLNDDHPIDIPYTDAAPNNAGLVPEGSLPGNITLSSGDITCGSCHDPHRTTTSTTDIDFIEQTTSGDLCLDCHGEK